MSSVNTTSVRQAAAIARARGATPADRLASMRTVSRATVEAPDVRPSGVEAFVPVGIELGAALDDFIAPPPRVVETLADARLGHTLRAAVKALDTDRADPSERYAAAVLRTHLEARNRLALRANALLKA